MSGKTYSPGSGDRFDRSGRVKNIYDAISNFGGNIDAFGRHRVANPRTLLDSQLEYDKQPLVFEESITGTGTVTHNNTESSVTLEVGTNLGDRVVRQSKRYFEYQPGKSQAILMTAVLGEVKEGVSKKLGYGNGVNGVFFKEDSGEYKVAIESETVGNREIPQSEWNLDTLDGTGPSKYNIDFSKMQLFFFDLEWLGSGSVRFGIFIGGELILFHREDNANKFLVPYMRTANLPVRYQIENTNVTGSNTSIKQVCSTVTSEGGLETKRGLVFSASNGQTATTVSNTAFEPVLAIRPKATFQGRANRVNPMPQSLKILAATNNARYRTILLPGNIVGHSLTGASWQDVNTEHSTIEYDISATSYSGGVQVDSGYITAGASARQADAKDESLLSRIPITNPEFNDQDIFLVAARGIGGSADIRTSLQWKEVR